MQLLLDTHFLLWSMAASRRLPVDVREVLTDPENGVFYSAASIWEIAIKSALRRRDFRVDLPRLLRALPRAGFAELPVSAEHAARVASLPALHKDPFDRLLVAQALVEPLVLLTNDAQLGRYDAQVRVI
ncbi:MAG: twitching motility protein PilT [Betaproteobacteria bacterium RIFCSPLOWO2_02_FULL_65_24]|nr:MAG: twitching motility protein PilT [Betaproteobacteria bacterium RIFCSPLOWO2_02_FULL_65_24]OGA96556.1 MAG: twitching motility protein PilT [Betaproteobacteria bacterium RIFCSPLOWO2_12_FULL_66_14]